MSLPYRSIITMEWGLTIQRVKIYIAESFNYYFMYKTDGYLNRERCICDEAETISGEMVEK